MADPKSALRQLETMKPVAAYGKVNKIVGLVAEGSGIRAPVGSLCHILPEAGQAAGAPLPGRDDGAEVIAVEVVGFRDDTLLFMPYADLRGV